MKTREQIQERIDKLEKRLSIIAKHHAKYVELYRKSLGSSKLRDIFYQRSSRYKIRYIELSETWRELMHYQKGLIWVLSEQKSGENNHE